MRWLITAWRLSVIVFTLSLYGLLGPFGYLAFWMLRWVPAPGGEEARARRLQGIIRRAFRLMHWWLRLTGVFRFDWRETLGEVPDGPCVLVANHPTLMDVTAVLGTVPLVTTVVRPDIYRQPWLRPLLIQARHFESVPVNSMDVERMVDEAVDRLKLGYRVVFFPEGTRTVESTLGVFGRVAFEVACRADVPIVPVTIRCAPRWLGKGDRFLRPPTATAPHLTLEVLAPVTPESVDGSSRALRDRVHSALAQKLAASPSEARLAEHGASTQNVSRSGPVSAGSTRSADTH